MRRVGRFPGPPCIRCPAIGAQLARPTVREVNYWESDSGPGDPMLPRSREDAVPTLLPTTHLLPTASWPRRMSWLLAVSEHDKFLGRAGEPRRRPRRCSDPANGIKVSPLASQRLLFENLRHLQRLLFENSRERNQDSPLIRKRFASQRFASYWLHSKT